MIKTDQISFSTSGAGDIIDITSEISTIVLNSGIASGTVTVFAPGSTTGITTLEFEPGLLRDLPELMEELIRGTMVTGSHIFVPPSSGRA